MNEYSEKIEKYKRVLEEADAVVIGAGAGLSTSAGFVYGGEQADEENRDPGCCDDSEQCECVGTPGTVPAG